MEHCYWKTINFGVVTIIPLQNIPQYFIPAYYALFYFILNCCLLSVLNEHAGDFLFFRKFFSSLPWSLMTINLSLQQRALLFNTVSWDVAWFDQKSYRDTVIRARDDLSAPGFMFLPDCSGYWCWYLYPKRFYTAVKGNWISERFFPHQLGRNSEPHFFYCWLFPVITSHQVFTLEQSTRWRFNFSHIFL